MTEAHTEELRPNLVHLGDTEQVSQVGGATSEHSISDRMILWALIAAIALALGALTVGLIALTSSRDAVAGPQGPTGAQGAPGVQGVQGAPGSRDPKEQPDRRDRPDRREPLVSPESKALPAQLERKVLLVRLAPPERAARSWRAPLHPGRPLSQPPIPRLGRP